MPNDGVAPAFGSPTLAPLSLGAVPWYDVQAAGYDVPGNGSPAAAALNALIAIIGAAEATLLFRAGTYQMNASVTVPANITVKMLQGAVVDVSAGQTFTANGPFDAPLSSVFAGAGSVVFGPGAVAVVRPQWWGGFLSASTAAQNMAALVAAKAALADGAYSAGYYRSVPIELPDGVFDVDNTVAFAIVQNIVIRGKTTRQHGRGTILFPTIANAVFDANGDYIWGWELSGITIDFADVANSQTNANCIGIRVRGGAVQGASNFLVENVFVRSPFVGFEDSSPVSFGYTVRNLEVSNPGSIGISVSGGGTTKRFERPLVSGVFAGGNNDGIYLANQRNVNLINPLVENLFGRHLYIVSCESVIIDDFFQESNNAVAWATGHLITIDTSSVRFNGAYFYSPQLRATLSAFLNIVGASKISIDSLVFTAHNQSGAGTFYNMLVAAAASVVVSNSPTLRTLMAGAATRQSISDVSGKVRFLEPSHKNTTAVSTAGVGEQELMTHALPAGTLNDGGGVKITAAGTITGAGGTKRISFYIGASGVAILIDIATTNNWSFEAELRAFGSSGAQALSYKLWDGSTLYQGFTAGFAENAESALNIGLRGTCAVGTDVITQRSLYVETL